MIKGFLLKTTPKMDKVTQAELLEEFDPLLEDFSEFMKGETYNMSEKEHCTDNYRFKSFSLSTSEGFDALWDIYNNIQRACPELIKLIRYSEKSFIAVIPLFEGESSNETFEILLDELVRLSAFFIKTFDDDDEIVDYISSYVDICVSWPGKTIKNSNYE